MKTSFDEELKNKGDAVLHRILSVAWRKWKNSLIVLDVRLPPWCK
jgi:hypothetical protein